MYVLGTAGHVDHGKSTLVRALTGIDPDRLPEEKEAALKRIREVLRRRDPALLKPEYLRAL